MYYHLLVPLAVGALALAFLALTLGRNAYLAFLGLVLSSTSQASNPLEWGYPATYLHGPALTSGWAVANCVSAYGGESGSQARRRACFNLSALRHLPERSMMLPRALQELLAPT
jgi:hypothetical protein